MTADGLYDRAREAASALVGLHYAHVHLGVNLSPAVVRELAKLFDCHVSAFVTTSLGRPIVIESLSGASFNGVRIEAQGMRPATADDAHLPGHIDKSECLATARSLLGSTTP